MYKTQSLLLPLLALVAQLTSGEPVPSKRIVHQALGLKQPKPWTPTTANSLHENQHVRVPAHHVPEAYLALFDPAKHDRIDAQIRSHQERVIESDMYGSMQQILESVMPTTERAAATENMRDIREQCRHADASSGAKRHRQAGSKVIPRTVANEVAGSNLFGATVCAVLGAIGVAALLL